MVFILANTSKANVVYAEQKTLNDAQSSALMMMANNVKNRMCATQELLDVAPKITKAVLEEFAQSLGKISKYSPEYEKLKDKNSAMDFMDLRKIFQSDPHLIHRIIHIANKQSLPARMAYLDTANQFYGEAQGLYSFNSAYREALTLKGSGEDIDAHIRAFKGQELGVQQILIFIDKCLSKSKLEYDTLLEEYNALEKNSPRISGEFLMDDQRKRDEVKEKLIQVEEKIRSQEIDRTKHAATLAFIKEKISAFEASVSPVGIENKLQEILEKKYALLEKGKERSTGENLLLSIYEAFTTPGLNGDINSLTNTHEEKIIEYRQSHIDVVAHGPYMLEKIARTYPDLNKQLATEVRDREARDIPLESFLQTFQNNYNIIDSLIPEDEHVSKSQDMMVLLLESRPGVGKTSIVEEIAKRMGTYLAKFSLPHMSETDLAGIAYVGRDENSFKQILGKSLVQLRDQPGGILFLDEFLAGDAAVMKLCCTTLQEGKISGNKIHPLFITVLAGNALQGDNVDVTPPGTALMTRFRCMKLYDENMLRESFITWLLNDPDWNKTPEDTQVAQMVASFFRDPEGKKFLLNATKETYNDEQGLEQEPTPRGWTKFLIDVANTLRQNLSRQGSLESDLKRIEQVASSLVGPAAASAFKRHVQLYMMLPSIPELCEKLDVDLNPGAPTAFNLLRIYESGGVDMKGGKLELKINPLCDSEIRRFYNISIDTMNPSQSILMKALAEATPAVKKEYEEMAVVGGRSSGTKVISAYEQASFFIKHSKDKSVFGKTVAEVLSREYPSKEKILPNKMSNPLWLAPKEELEAFINDVWGGKFDPARTAMQIIFTDRIVNSFIDIFRRHENKYGKLPPAERPPVNIKEAEMLIKIALMLPKPEQADSAISRITSSVLCMVGAQNVPIHQIITKNGVTRVSNPKIPDDVTYVVSDFRNVSKEIPAKNKLNNVLHVFGTLNLLSACSEKFSAKLAQVITDARKAMDQVTTLSR